jgi:hypothetical protein
MKFKNSISLLVLTIIIFAITASVWGIFSYQGPGKQVFHSLRGENVTIYGKGLYRYDSVSMASQAKAQDIVTLFLGIPVLMGALYFAVKGSFKGRLLLAGILGYFLYTYASYSFLAMYNPLFLVYVFLMSASFFAFTLVMMSWDGIDLRAYFNPKLPVNFIGGFLIFLAVMIGLMWLGRIMPSLMKGSAPVGLEHYTTLVIQGLDLGFVVPTAILSGLLFIRRKPFGYLLAPVIMIKGIALLTAIIAMIIGMVHAGVKVSVEEMTLFPLFDLVAVYWLIQIMKNVKESDYKPRKSK